LRTTRGNVIARYAYDPFGRRIWKDVGGTRTYIFHYSDEGLVGEYDAAGDVIKTYGWKPGSTWGTDPLSANSQEGIPEVYRWW
jgi:YD repeat-containing protein